MSRQVVQRVMAALAAIAVLAVPLALAPPAAAQDRLIARFAIELSGDQEVPPVAGGESSARIWLVPRAGLACWVVDFSDVVGDPTRFHIHRAPSGSNGGVVVGFFDQVVNPDDKARRAGCVRADEAILQAIVDNPENYYANLHTNVFPPGAVRGQLA